MTVEINPEDLRIDTFHACEHSGFVHTNHTAVRITHLPTGAYVESKTERSPHRNKMRCMELLPAAVAAKLCTPAPSGRAEELITQLEAEIVKRDARIAELEAPMLAWSELDYTKHTRRSLMCYIGQQNFRITAQEKQLAALKAHAVSVPVAMPERWEDRLSRMHQTIQAGCWPKRWVDDAKDYELGELRALLAQSQEVKS